MKPAHKPLLLFLLLLCLFPAISAAVRLAGEGVTAVAVWEWPLLVALPALLWIWFRHFSVLGCRDDCHPRQ